jgi:hypothetical protein
MAYCLIAHYCFNRFGDDINLFFVENVTRVIIFKEVGLARQTWLTGKAP